MTCPPQPSDFEVRTKAELIRLAAEAAKACPGHICPDKAPCRHCAKYRTLHERINDHIDQLRGDEPELTPVQAELLASYAGDKAEDRTLTPICRCGRARHVIRDAALVCLDCDMAALPSLGLGSE